MRFQSGLACYEVKFLELSSNRVNKLTLFSIMLFTSRANVIPNVTRYFIFSELVAKIVGCILNRTFMKFDEVGQIT